MMKTKINDHQEFEILGFKVRFKSQIGEQVEANKVVDLVNREIQNIKKTNSNLETGQAMLLVALKMASEKISLEKEYKEFVESLKSTATDALCLIEEVSSQTTTF